MQNPTAIRTRTRQRAASQAREIPWSFLLLVIVCACVVAAGFFFAARQHFTSMDYGIKNSKLREQLESLEAEKRRLQLAREVALSPASVRKAARQVGLREITPEDVAVVAVAAKSPAGTDAAAVLDAPKTTPAKNADRPRVVPAVMSAPVKQKPDGEVRKRVVDSQKDKKEKVEVAALLKLR